MPKKKSVIMTLVLIFTTTLIISSACSPFIRNSFSPPGHPVPQEVEQARKEANELLDDLTDTNSSSDKDQDSKPEPPPYVPQVPDPFTELYDNLKLHSLDWGFNSMYPTASNDDRVKVVFFQDENGDWVFSIMGEAAGLTEPQVDMIGWGYWTLEIDSPWSGPSPDVVFPCDEDITNLPPDQDWFTICPEGAGVSSGNKWYVVYSIFDDPIITNDPDLSYTFAAVFDADGNPDNNFPFMEPYNWDYWQNTDQWYIVDWMNVNQSWNAYVMGQNWETVESNARAVIYDNALFWIIPTDEFSVIGPGGRVSSFATRGGFDRGNVGGDVNGDDPTEPLTPLDSDPIHVMDPPFTLVSIALDSWNTCGPGYCQYNEGIVEQQKTIVFCTDPGDCSKVSPPSSHCALFSRAKGDSPQDPDSWSYVAGSNVKIQKDWSLVYHCFCVK